MVDTDDASDETDADLERIRERKLERLRERVERGESADEADVPSSPIAVEDAAHLSTVLERHEAVLVDFYADWCGPCQMLAPVLERLAGEVPAAVAKVDTDAHPSLAERYGVRGLPTLVLFSAGEPVERLVGMQDEATLRRVIDEHASS